MQNQLNRPLAAFVAIPREAIDELVSQVIELSNRGNIRTTTDGRYSVLDVISVVVGKSSKHKVWERLQAAFPETLTNCQSLKLPRSNGRKGGLPSPVGDQGLRSVRFSWGTQRAW